MQNIVDLIFSRNHNKIALAGEDVSLSYQDLQNLVFKTVNFLQSKNIKKADRVIIALGNSVENIILHYAIIEMGAVSVPLTADLANDRLDFFIQDLDAKIAFVRNNLNHNIAFKVNDYSNFISNIDGYNNSFNQINVDAEDLISIMYTTGTTGVPKGVCLTHGCVNQALNNIINYVGYDGSQKEVVALPIYHNFGLGHIYCTHLTGGMVFVQDGIKSPKIFFKVFENDKYNGMPLTPSMLKILLGRFREKFLPILQNLSYIVVNSEALPPEITKDIIDNCPNLKLMFYYGLTEASRSTFITLSQEPEKYYKSVGKPTSEDVKIKIIDDEICIAGNHLFKEYWNNVVESNIVDGWFKTGDLGAIDENGYLFITGRKKDQINIGGLKISAFEIAKVIKTMPNILDVAVVAIPDNILGEVPAALVVANNITGDDIVSYCKNHLEIFALPKKIIFADSIPKSQTGKILAADVKKIILENL